MSMKPAYLVYDSRHQCAVGEPYRARSDAPRRQRTEAEIQAQLAARLAQMEADAERPERVWPCATCRHSHGVRCRQPLIQGFDRKDKPSWDFDKHHTDVKLCGPEKALWEPRRTIGWWIARLIGLFV